MALRHVPHFLAHSGYPVNVCSIKMEICTVLINALGKHGIKGKFFPSSPPFLIILMLEHAAKENVRIWANSIYETKTTTPVPRLCVQPRIVKRKRRFFQGFVCLFVCCFLDANRNQNKPKMLLLSLPFWLSPNKIVPHYL